MKSGPVFLWRGSVALLCEARQRLMIRWNIQTSNTKRQAHWYAVVKPNRGLAQADPQTFMHVHVFATHIDTYSSNTHSHMLPLLPLCKGIDIWPKHSIKGIYRKVMGIKNKWQWDSEKEQSGYWFLLCAGRWRKKVSCMREIFLSPWWTDCKQLHTPYSRCMLWSMIFHHVSLLLKKRDRG